MPIGYRFGSNNGQNTKRGKRQLTLYESFSNGLKSQRLMSSCDGGDAKATSSNNDVIKPDDDVKENANNYMADSLTMSTDEVEVVVEEISDCGYDLCDVEEELIEETTAFGISLTDEIKDFDYATSTSLNTGSGAVIELPHRNEQRWRFIKSKLQQRISTADELIDIISSYHIGNGKHQQNFQLLKQLINDVFSKDERDRFFGDTLPFILRSALSIESVLPSQVAALSQSRGNSKLIFSRKQVTSIVANQFLCTLTRSDDASYPIAIFTGLFMINNPNHKRPRNSSRMEKLKCIISYFDQMRRERSNAEETVELHRQAIKTESLIYNQSQQTLLSTRIIEHGFIEEAGTGILQMDFANSYVGGGVLRSGCVQEEIRFVCNAECLISLLFTQRLLDNEVCFIRRTKQYSKYAGYGDSFKFDGETDDLVESEIVAADATKFTQPLQQYKKSSFDRELMKATAAFYNPRMMFATLLTPVATGNWGCGAFKGDPEFKFVIQLLAASVCERSPLYYTFGDVQLAINLRKMQESLCNRSVADVYRLLHEYHLKHIAFLPKGSHRTSFAEFVEMFKF